MLSLQISNILALIMSMFTLVYLFCVNGAPCCAVDFIYPITLLHRTLVPNLQIFATLYLLFYGKFIVDKVCCIVSQYDVDEQSARVYGTIRLIGFILFGAMIVLALGDMLDFCIIRAFLNTVPDEVKTSSTFLSTMKLFDMSVILRGNLWVGLILFFVSLYFIKRGKAIFNMIQKGLR